MASMFIKFTDIKGETRDAAFPEFFEIESFNFDASCAFDASTFKATGNANYSPLTVSMSVHDKAASTFFDFLNKKKVMAEVLLQWRHTEDEQAVLAWEVTFEKAKFVSVNASVSGGDMPSANYMLSLVYDKYTLMTRSTAVPGKPEDGLEVPFSPVENA